MPQSTTLSKWVGEHIPDDTFVCWNAAEPMCFDLEWLVHQRPNGLGGGKVAVISVSATIIDDVHQDTYVDVHVIQISKYEVFPKAHRTLLTNQQHVPPSPPSNPPPPSPIAHAPEGHLHPPHLIHITASPSIAGGLRAQLGWRHHAPAK